ncbi:MAG: cytochrome C, partial [Sulfurimonas sp.]
MKSLILLAALASVVLASSYDKKGVAAATDKLYVKECGACHFAYQPGLLPSNAWQKMMSNLENHFGSDASLAKEDFDSISKYLN